MFAKIFILAIIINIVHPLTKDFNQQIANRIFKGHEPYLIFMTSSTDQQLSATFQQYCVQRMNCTILASWNQQFEHISSFIGYDGQNYCLILDAHNHFKYIFPIDQDIDFDALANFQAQYQSGQATPFFASEVIQQLSQNEKCIKLSGKTYEDFLVQDEPVKIVYLYTESKFCKACEQFLSQFQAIANQYFERNVIRFGYIDVLKNDNRFIKDQIFPYFLIYIRDNFDDPYGVGANEFEQMDEFVQTLIKDVKKSKYTENPEDEEEL